MFKRYETIYKIMKDLESQVSTFDRFKEECIGSVMRHMAIHPELPITCYIDEISRRLPSQEYAHTLKFKIIKPNGYNKPLKDHIITLDDDEPIAKNVIGDIFKEFQRYTHFMDYKKFHFEIGDDLSFKLVANSVEGS